MKKVIYMAALAGLMTGILSPSHVFAQKFSKKFPADELLAGAEACARLGLLNKSNVDFDQLKSDPASQLLVLSVERVDMEAKNCYQSKLNEGQLEIISGTSD